MQENGEEVKIYMNKKIDYKTAPKDVEEALKQPIFIEDFLPKPEDIKLSESSEKITINLSKKSIIFFKKESKKLGLPYQRMIKTVLDAYTEKYL